MSMRDKANTIVEKIKKYQEDTDGWKMAKNSVSVKRAFLTASNSVRCTRHLLNYDSSLHSAQY